MRNAVTPNVAAIVYSPFSLKWLHRADAPRVPFLSPDPAEGIQTQARDGVHLSNKVAYHCTPAVQSCIPLAGQS